MSKLDDLVRDSMEYSLLDLLQMQKHHFRPSACFSWKYKLPGTSPSPKLVHNSAPISPSNSFFVSAPPYTFVLSENCLYTLYSFMQGKKLMTPKLRPSYADSVTTTSWSPWPKAWMGNHYRQRAGFMNMSAWE